MSGFKIPLAVGYDDEELSAFSGFDINFYPFGQKKTCYYLGPKVRAGLLNDRFFNYDVFWAVLINNGVSITPKEKFNFNISAGIGIISEYDDTDFEPWATINFSLGYRF